MSNNIILKKSSVGDKVPLASDLEHGELALNFTDGNLFYKNNSNTVITIASNKFVSVTGNVTGGNILASGAVIAATLAGNGSAIASITGGNVTGQVSNALVSGTVYTAAQPNITSVGTLTSVSVTGNVTGGNLITAGLVSVTGNITGGNLSGTSIAGTLTTAAQPNITSVGTLTSVSVSGNIDGGNIAGNGAGLTSITGANVTGQVGNALVAGTVYTAAQPNITSVGTLTALSVTGNVTTGNILTNGYFFANGVPFTGGGSVGGTFNVFARSGAIIVSVIAGFFDVGTRNSGTLKVAVS